MATTYQVQFPRQVRTRLMALRKELEGMKDSIAQATAVLQEAKYLHGQITATLQASVESLALSKGLDEEVLASCEVVIEDQLDMVSFIVPDQPEEEEWPAVDEWPEEG